MRRLAAVSVLAALAIVPHAFAAPVTGVDEGAGAGVVLTTAGGQRYELRILATLATRASTATAPKLRVLLLESGTKRSGDLSASGFTMRGGTATLSARLGDVPLRVVWQVNENTAAASLVEAGSDLESSDGWTVAGKGGSAQVTLGAVRCTTNAAVIGTVVAHDTDGYGGPLTQGLGLTLSGARCSSPASNDFPPLP